MGRRTKNHKELVERQKRYKKLEKEKKKFSYWVNIFLKGSDQ